MTKKDTPKKYNPPVSDDGDYVDPISNKNNEYLGPASNKSSGYTGPNPSKDDGDYVGATSNKSAGGYVGAGSKKEPYYDDGPAAVGGGEAGTESTTGKGKAGWEYLRKTMMPVFKGANKREELVHFKLHKNDMYVQEVGQQKHAVPGLQERLIMRLTPEELKEYEVSYDPASRRLRNNDNTLATTQGEITKEVANQQAFVLTDKGVIRKGTHLGGRSQPGVPTLFHSTLTGKGESVKMAGTFELENGLAKKVLGISGHYQPTEIEFFDGLQAMQTKMPGILRPDTEVTYLNDKSQRVTQSLADFITKMETPGIGGKPLHQTLREAKVSEKEQYGQDLKSAKSIVIESDKDLVSTIANLPPATQADLKLALEAKLVNVAIKDPSGKISHHTIKEISEAALKSYDPKATEVLLNAGISNREEFKKLDPLQLTMDSNNTAGFTTLLKDDNMQNALCTGIDKEGQKLTLLHQAVAWDNKETVEAILNVPQGKVLAPLKDANGFTALDAAKHNKQKEIIHTFKEQDPKAVKAERTQFLMDDKNSQSLKKYAACFIPDNLTKHPTKAIAASFKEFQDTLNVTKTYSDVSKMVNAYSEAYEKKYPDISPEYVRITAEKNTKTPFKHSVVKKFEGISQKFSTTRNTDTPAPAKKVKAPKGLTLSGKH